MFESFCFLLDALRVLLGFKLFAHTDADKIDSKADNDHDQACWSLIDRLHPERAVERPILNRFAHMLW